MDIQEYGEDKSFYGLRSVRSQKDSKERRGGQQVVRRRVRRSRMCRQERGKNAGCCNGKHKIYIRLLSHARRYDG